jgi:hypothetical protein
MPRSTGWRGCWRGARTPATSPAASPAWRVEDVGLADPQAQALCLQAWETYERLGSPEGELALAQAVVYLALAPKSNATYTAYKAARRLAKTTGSKPPPAHILNAPTKLMKEQGYGAGYEYDHDAEDGFSGQDYFPEGVKRPVLYAPPDRGFERELKKRVDYFAKLRGSDAVRAAVDKPAAAEKRAHVRNPRTGRRWRRARRDGAVRHADRWPSGTSARPFRWARCWRTWWGAF